MAPGSEVRILHVGDVHVSDTPPGYRTDSYRDDILAKLQFVMEESIRSEVDAVLFVGDLFHHRRRVSHALLADVADLLALHPRVLLLPGNHDLIDNVLSEVGRQPVGILGRLPNVEVALDYTVISSPNNDVHVRITPVPYRSGLGYVDCRVVPDPNFTQLPGARFEVLWVHYGITEHELVHHTLVVSDPRWQPGHDCDLVLAGHIHDDLGTFGSARLKDGRPPVVNFGSLSRGSLTEDALTRQPRVPLVRFVASPTSALQVVPIDVPCRPASEVFRLEDKLAETNGDRLASDFLASLDSAHVAVLSPEEVRETLQRSGAPAPVVTLALQALDEVID